MNSAEALAALSPDLQVLFDAGEPGPLIQQVANICTMYEQRIATLERRLFEATVYYNTEQDYEKLRLEYGKEKWESLGGIWPADKLSADKEGQDA